MIGLVDRERVDEELYDDFESAKAREVCSLVHIIVYKHIGLNYGYACICYFLEIWHFILFLINFPL